jgi:hypothetical protein
MGINRALPSRTACKRFLASFNQASSTSGSGLSKLRYSSSIRESLSLSSNRNALSTNNLSMILQTLFTNVRKLLEYRNCCPSGSPKLLPKLCYTMLQRFDAFVKRYSAVRHLKRTKYANGRDPGYDRHSNECSPPPRWVLSRTPTRKLIQPPLSLPILPPHPCRSVTSVVIDPTIPIPIQFILSDHREEYPG